MSVQTTAHHLAKDQPAEITMFQISEVQDSPAFNGWRSFLTLRATGPRYRSRSPVDWRLSPVRFAANGRSAEPWIEFIEQLESQPEITPLKRQFGFITQNVTVHAVGNLRTRLVQGIRLSGFDQSCSQQYRAEHPVFDTRYCFRHIHGLRPFLMCRLHQ